MSVTPPYQLLADAVLFVHFAFVVFVVGGLAFIVVGNLRDWRWARSLWFRLAHLAAITVVTAQSWLGAACPLTSIEMWLRARAGETTYAGSFIEYWLQNVLFFEAPGWVFTLVYTVFGLIVAATWRYFPPRRNQPLPKK